MKFCHCITCTDSECFDVPCGSQSVRERYILWWYHLWSGTQETIQTSYYKINRLTDIENKWVVMSVGWKEGFIGTRLCIQTIQCKTGSKMPLYKLGKI